MSSDIIRFDEIDELGPQSYSEVYTFTPQELDRLEIAGVGPVRTEANVEKGDLPGEYIADGQTHFTVDFNCSRCLDPYPFATTSAFHVRFQPRPAVSAENEEVEITEEGELDVEFYTERQIPLRDLALEQVQLSIPMKPLCEERCLGLCSQCGANRNRESCTCATSVVDERWGALQDIRAQLTKKKDV